MQSRFNYGKIILVCFITALIWVYADLALDETYEVADASITVSKSASRRFWVTFDGESSVEVEKLVFKGPAGRISDLRRGLEEGTVNAEFTFDPTRDGLDTPGVYPLDLADFVRDNKKTRQLGLTVESCKPQRVMLDVVELVKKPVKIRCVRQRDNIGIEGAMINPEQIEMYVHSDWRGERLSAEVQLSESEIKQARVSPVSKAPYIKLTPGEIRYARQSVQIRTPRREDPRKSDVVKKVALGMTLSSNLQGRYKVEILNPDAVMSAISVRATPKAKAAYEGMRYQVLLEIEDSDKDAGGEGVLKRQLVYNFPAEYVRLNEIELNQQPEAAKFRLVPVSGEQSGPGGGSVER